MTIAGRFLLAAALATGADGEPSHVAIHRFPEAESCGAVILSATPVGGSGSAIRWTNAAHVDLSAAEEWSLSAESRGCWSPTLHVRRDTPNIVVPLWREATLIGRLVVPKGATIPASVELRIESTTVPESRFPCPVVEGRLRCAIPATSLDLRLAAAGFAPRYFFGVERPSLGDVAFTPGGSIAGMVRFDGDGPKLSELALELKPESPPLKNEGWSAEEKRLASRAVTVRPGERGFFQFANVEPGQYTITTRREGWSRLRHAGIEVTDGHETALAQPLVIEPLAEVDVFIQPPLDPYGKPWQVSLSEMVPLSSMSTPIVETEASMSGAWSAAGIDSGYHRIDVMDHRGSKFTYSIVDVSPRMSPVSITLSNVLVRGTIRIGDDPLRAQVEFRNGKGTMITMRSDAEGRFSGALPQDGRWETHVATGRPARWLRRSVDVSPTRGIADIDLHFAGTRVAGTVLSRSGVPGSAFVRLWDDEERVLGSTSTDERGDFQLLGIEPGTAHLQAESRDSRTTKSEVLTLAVGETPIEDLSVVLRPAARLRGRLITPSGFRVAGAIVRYRIPDRPRHSTEEISGPDGTFTIYASPGTPAVDLVILPPALPVKIARVPMSDGPGHTTDIVVGGPAGLLEIEMDHPTPSGPGSELFIEHRGAVHHVATLNYPANWTSVPRGFHRWGKSVEIEAGQYTLCGDRAMSDRCVRKTIAPGSVERVDGRSLQR